MNGRLGLLLFLLTASSMGICAPSAKSNSNLVGLFKDKRLQIIDPKSGSLLGESLVLDQRSIQRIESSPILLGAISGAQVLVFDGVRGDFQEKLLGIGPLKNAVLQTNDESVRVWVDGVVVARYRLENGQWE